VINLLSYNSFINESKIYEHPLFHGSGRKFDIFDFNRLGQDGHLLSFLGIHFTENDTVAERFTNPPDYIIYEIELKYNKFLKIKEGNLVKEMLKFGLEKKIIDLSIFPSKNIFDLPYFGTKNCLMNQLFNLTDGKAKEISLEYKNHLMNQGYDCIKYINEIESPDIKRFDWIIFKSEQIKVLKVWDLKPRLEIKW
jgi:hypothetical protein